MFFILYRRPCADAVFRISYFSNCNEFQFSVSSPVLAATPVIAMN